jgi:hypothetical protein
MAHQDPFSAIGAISSKAHVGDTHSVSKAGEAGAAGQAAGAGAVAQQHGISTKDSTNISTEALEDVKSASGSSHAANVAHGLRNSQGPAQGMASGGVVTSAGGYHNQVQPGFSTGGVYTTNNYS